MYFITSEKLLVKSEQNSGGNAETKNDSNDAFGETSEKVQHIMMDNMYFYQDNTVAVTSSTTSEQPETVASELPEEFEPTQPRFEYKTTGAMGERYKGRLGIPSTPNYKLHSRRLQPGPRFRNGMNIPKHLSGKSYCHVTFLSGKS